ncbi:MAG: FtsW/RodA/SpoVE family cell cycle protein [Kiloniellales bacterium]
MSALARTDTSTLGRWWWTVDRWTLAVLILLIVTGMILSVTASPPVATRLDLDPFHFVRRHMLLLLPAVAVLFAVSLLSPRGVRRLALITFIAAVTLLTATIAAGPEIKGANRWISLAGFTLQPSEFVKPAFAVVAAWMFAEHHRSRRAQQVPFPGNALATLLYLAVFVLLLMQPDLGMAFVVSVVWYTQFCVAGLSLGWVGVFAVLGLAVLFGAYMVFPHVASRVDRFLDPASGDSYQIDRALEAFRNGGLLGRGPGEGTVKQHIPDAHADFVFAVAGEEFGLVACLAIVGLFAFVVLRGFGRLLEESNPFVALAACGLLVQFGVQALINLASTVQLIPTKGMTLPFLSYGGSSLLALSLGMGMFLALTRHRAQLGDRP